MPRHSPGRTSAAQIDGYGGVWNAPITTGRSLGLLGFQAGTGTNLYSVYLRRDGSLPMTGGLNMSDGIIHNINNAGNITGTGQFQSTQVVTSYDKSNGNLDMTGTATIIGNANISGGVGAGGRITATGEFYSSTSLQTNGYLNAGDNIYGNGYLAVTGKVQGSYMEPTGGASAGGGRAPDAAIGNDGAQDLFCKNGVDYWRLWRRPIRPSEILARWCISSRRSGHVPS
ncbi:hypothetical protein [Burkholderia paludis]|uniref:hypothetical protein n=1 Tax=Burkholderia paludis TaxID=1506587 RepID=UPI00126A53BF|nr:hypothetical protein [Burkholderia paludis]